MLAVGKFVIVVSLISVASWPNLDTMIDPGYSKGSCTLIGGAKPGTAKAQSNALKNRYKLPSTGGATPMTWAQFLALPYPHVANAKEAIREGVRLAGTKRYVSFTGYVEKAKSENGGESCNCGATVSRLCDTHIELVRSPKGHDIRSKDKIIVETTSRIRKLASMGLLPSSGLPSATDWSTANLKSMIHHWVRVEGWLFYDSDHYYQDWQSDPQDNLTKKGEPIDPLHPEHNWRATCWEIHPVMKIEVLKKKPKHL